MISIAQLPEMARKAEGSTKAFFKKLQKQKPKSLDTQMQNLHDEVFEKVDCLACANCCKTTSPIFYQRDIERVAKRLKLPIQKFIAQYVHLDEDKDYVLNVAPCPFLDSENFCIIYEDRPNACRDYPHTNRKRFVQILNLTLRNTFICPAVYEIVEKLKVVK